MTLRQGYLLSLESFIDVINKKEKTQITKFTNGTQKKSQQTKTITK
jgi:hypothetical protein